MDAADPPVDSIERYMVRLCAQHLLPDLGKRNLLMPEIGGRVTKTGRNNRLSVREKNERVCHLADVLKVGRK
jgi:hypothetical protein